MEINKSHPNGCTSKPKGNSSQVFFTTAALHILRLHGTQQKLLRKICPGSYSHDFNLKKYAQVLPQSVELLQCWLTMGLARTEEFTWQLFSCFASKKERKTSWDI